MQIDTLELQCSALGSIGCSGGDRPIALQQEAEQ